MSAATSPETLDSLIGEKSNPALIRRAFERIIKLLEGLSRDVVKPLPKDARPVPVSGDVRSPDQYVQSGQVC